MRTMLNVGVLLPGFKYPKVFFGKTPSRPIPNSNRAAPKVPVNPLPNAATIRITAIALNRRTPPIRQQMSLNAVSRFGKLRQSGQTRAPRYDSKQLSTPANKEVSHTETNTLRFGLSTYHASLVAP